MKNKIVTLLIGICIGSMFCGCESEQKKVQAEEVSKFKTIHDENVSGLDISIVKDKEYNHEYIIVTRNWDCRSGIGIIERNKN